MRKIPTSLLPFIALFAATSLFSQVESDHLRHRKIILTTGASSAYLGSMIALDQLWYSDFEQTPLHSFDDASQWLQMDKVGHLTTSYQLGKAGHAALRWAGVSDQSARILGGSFGFLYLGGVELLDGKSSEWGFSWSDLGANALGSAAFIAQDAIWNEQRIQFKYSYQKSPYAKYRPEVLGSSASERWLKDYNGQTYWASIRVADFLREDHPWPDFLCVSIGYGADGMLGAENNPLFSDNNTLLPYFERQRQFYLSLDLDLSSFASNRKVLRALLNTFGFIKIPAPTLLLQNGNLRFYPLFF